MTCARTGAGGGMPKPEDMAKLTDELKNNPEMMQNMTNMVRSLTSICMG